MSYITVSLCSKRFDSYSNMVMMKLGACLLAVVVLVAMADDEQRSADDYLEKFGYLDPLGKRSVNPRVRAAARLDGIKEFQRFAHLPETGQLDEPTKQQMMAPRCGMSDVSHGKRRSARRYYSKWEKEEITWKLAKGTQQLDDGQVRKAIKEAFEVWAKVIPLNFTEVHADAESDMQFGFGAKDHGDVYNFDGRGSVLAHAFFPSDGRLHFDDDEAWTYEDASQIRDGSYTDLLSVTIHEMGHALGLPHLSEQEAIMYPYYRHPELDENGQIKPFVLNQFDIDAIQEAYGPREGATPRPTTAAPTPEPTPPGGPSQGARCPSFGAAVTGPGGITYFFDGEIGWKKNDVDRDPANSGARFYLDRRFPGGPKNRVTAAVTDKGASKTYLFDGWRVYGYSWRSSNEQYTMLPDFPKDLGEDVPFQPEGAFQLNGGHIILFYGDDFVIWDPSANKSIFKGTLGSYFGTFPAKASFAVDDRLYFVNENEYFIFDLDKKQVVSTAPLDQLITC